MKRERRSLVSLRFSPFPENSSFSVSAPSEDGQLYLSLQVPRQHLRFHTWMGAGDAPLPNQGLLPCPASPGSPSASSPSQPPSASWHVVEACLCCSPIRRCPGSRVEPSCGPTACQNQRKLLTHTPRTPSCCPTVQPASSPQPLHLGLANSPHPSGLTQTHHDFGQRALAPSWRTFPPPMTFDLASLQPSKALPFLFPDLPTRGNVLPPLNPTCCRESVCHPSSSISHSPHRQLLHARRCELSTGSRAPGGQKLSLIPHYTSLGLAGCLVYRRFSKTVLWNKIELNTGEVVFNEIAFVKCSPK